MERNLLIIVKLDSNGLQFYDTANDNSYTFVGAPDAIRDGEIINQGVLEVKLKNFLEENKIKQSQLLFILSKNIIYEKDFSPNETNLEGQIKEFVECIPFENVGNKTYNIGNNLRAAAFNKDFIEDIMSTFTDNSFVVVAAIPYFLINDGDELNKSASALVLKNYDTLIKESAIEQTQMQTAGITKKQKEKKSELIALIIVLLVFATLIAVYIFEQKQSAVPKKIPARPEILPTKVITPTTVASSAANLNNQTLIRIQSAKDTIPLAQRLQSQLIQQGLSNTQIENEATNSAEKTTVVFSSAVPLTTRNLLLDNLKLFINDFVVQESASIKFDILIILGRLT